MAPIVSMVVITGRPVLFKMFGMSLHLRLRLFLFAEVSYAGFLSSLRCLYWFHIMHWYAQATSGQFFNLWTLRAYRRLGVREKFCYGMF